MWQYSRILQFIIASLVNIMAIQTSTFSGWQLTDEHAEALLKIVNDPSPNLLAMEACAHGDKLAKEFIENGFVRMNPEEYFKK